MLPAHLADRLLKQRRKADSAEFARQLPLHAPLSTDDARWMIEPGMIGPEDEATPAPAPDWATRY